MMLTLKKYNRKLNAGFSLVELMVGLVIGGIATLVILEVFSVFEGQKSTTTGSADAQTNGSIALYSIQRDIQMAGFGLPVPMADKENSPFLCDPLPLVFPALDVGMFPVEIIDGGANPGASDVIIARYSASQNAMGSVPVRVGNIENPLDFGVVVDTNMGCNPDDLPVGQVPLAFIQNTNSCFMAQINSIEGENRVILSEAPLDMTAYNGANTSNTKLTCMGAWRDYRYQVNNGLLERNVIDETRPIVAGVVNLQAQYGVSASPDSNQVTEWVDAVGAWSAPSVANRGRIKAVRVALVARSDKRETAAVTAACTTPKGVINEGPCAWDDTNFNNAPKIVLEEGWENYRYRVFDTIIPLRNMIWSKEAL